MTKPLILVTIPGLRAVDLPQMPHLNAIAAGGDAIELIPGVPAVGSAVEANMTTGLLPDSHGVIGNGFYFSQETFPDRPIKNKRYWGELPIDESFAIPPWPPENADQKVEMWSSPAECVGRPQIWDKIRRNNAALTSMLWFPHHIEGATADYLCNGDYSRPFDYYLELKRKLGDFPIVNLWGPAANRKASDWIIASAVECTKKFQPNFTWIQIPYLDVPCQKFGPDSPEFAAAVAELDEMTHTLFEGMNRVCKEEPIWLIAGEFAATAVDSVFYPNRVLREMKLLSVTKRDDGEYLNIPISRAFAICDHQIAHIYFNVPDETLIRRVADRFRQIPELETVLVLEERKKFHLDHPRSGEIVLISRENSWCAYPWWFEDGEAPNFARSVAPTYKPGHDPNELFWDAKQKSILFDPKLVRGSYGAPAKTERQRTVLLTSSPKITLPKPKGKKKIGLADTMVSRLAVDYFLYATD